MKAIKTRLYNQKSCEDVITFCKRFERIYLYGAGLIAREAIIMFADLGIEIDSVLVSDGRKSADTFLDAYAVFELLEKEIRHEDGVIIGLHDKGDVYDTLAAMVQTFRLTQAGVWV